MNSCRSLALLPFLLASLCTLSGPLCARGDDTAARPAQDPSLTAAEGLLKMALGGALESGPVMGDLRGSGDPALAPLFHKVSQTKDPVMQIYGIVAENYVTKDPAKLDIHKILSCPRAELVGPALSSIIDYGAVSDQELQTVVADAPDSNQQMMAASELVRRKAKLPTGTLDKLSNSVKEAVRAYAALTMLQLGENPSKALGILKDLAVKADPDSARIQGLLMLRAKDQKIQAALPFATAIYENKEQDDLHRISALAVLLYLHDPDAGQLLGDYVAQKAQPVKDPDTGNISEPEPGPLIKLGLISLEYADQLSSSELEPLQRGVSNLQHQIGKLAVRAANGQDVTEGIIDLLKEGHPIVLDWALLYSDRCETHRAQAILKELIDQATTVDDVREQDFERAAMAAQKLSTADQPAARAEIAHALRAPNDGIVEAVLVGLSKSERRDLSEILRPLWPQWIKTRPSVNIMNYSALILAREGQQEPKDWLGKMVQGEKTNDPGLRCLAGWYYIKLSGQTNAVLGRILASSN